MGLSYCWDITVFVSSEAREAGFHFPEMFRIVGGVGLKILRLSREFIN